jgi:pimeloyl-ACP methyl ester carboxylesterase
MKPIVFVHGFACTHADWRLQTAHFSGRHSTFAPDLRGHGATHARPEDCSIETYGADIAALLDGKGLNGAVLIGHSMGCRVVLQAYLDAPERVAALALIDGSFLGGGNPVLIENYPKFARALFADMFLSPSDLGTEIVDRALRLPEAVGAALFPRMARWDAANMERALAAVKVPMLVIQSTYLNAERKRVALKPGESSPWLDLVRKQAPRAQVEIVTGVGHFPQLEAAERVNKLLSELINV